MLRERISFNFIFKILMFNPFFKRYTVCVPMHVCAHRRICTDVHISAHTGEYWVLIGSRWGSHPLKLKLYSVWAALLDAGI